MLAAIVEIVFTRTARSSFAIGNPFRLRGYTARKGPEVTHREAEGAGLRLRVDVYLEVEKY